MGGRRRPDNGHVLVQLLHDGSGLRDRFGDLFGPDLGWYRLLLRLLLLLGHRLSVLGPLNAIPPSKKVWIAGGVGIPVCGK